MWVVVTACQNNGSEEMNPSTKRGRKMAPRSTAQKTKL